MKRPMNWLIASPIILVLLIIGTALVPKGAAHVGLKDGYLRPCPESPNCVRSESDSQAECRIAPLRFTGSADAAWKRVTETVIAAGGDVHEQGDGYLWATFTTRWLHFVDDLELRMDAERHVIQVRSASRIGYSDLGVNRHRVERLRRLFNS